ncbi:MAG: DUF202 domain-containing protein [Micropruina glycogenica]|nr:DUF202 domain-containing protein [Propionibacteriaceae bacterium]
MTSDQHQHPPWDSGLQAERTSLSWQRVNLAGLACGLVSARLLIETHPLAGYSLAVLTAVGACLLAFLHGGRLQRTTAALRAGVPLPDGRIHVLLVVLLILGAAGGLISVLAYA